MGRPKGTKDIKIKKKKQKTRLKLKAIQRDLGPIGAKVGKKHAVGIP